MNAKTTLALAALTFFGAGLTQSFADDAVEAARQKRTADLREVATDRTQVKQACVKKDAACAAAQSKFKSDLSVYHADQATFRSLRSKSTAGAAGAHTPHSSNKPMH